MKDNRITIGITLAALVIIGVTACGVSGNKKTPTVDNAIPVVTEEVSKDSLVPEETNIVENEEMNESSEAAAPAPDEIVLPTVRVGLESTNPASVTLASGQLQLVEFFAFW